MIGGASQAGAHENGLCPLSPQLQASESLKKVAADADSQAPLSDILILQVWEKPENLYFK